MARFAVAATAACIALAACGGGGESEPAPSEVTGMITEVHRTGGEVTSFTVRTDDDTTYRLATPRDVAYGFDLDHLDEHRTTGDPVRCAVEERDGRLVATAIDDA